MVNERGFSLLTEKCVFERVSGGCCALPGGQDPAAPGLGVYSSWLGGLPGWLSGAWWFEKREMTKRQVSDMKRTELSSGRVAM